MKYKAVKNSRITDKIAETFGEFLENEFPKGGITAEAVVAKASKKSCVVHDYFEWDDTKAGHMWRLEQAGNLIRSIVVENGENDGIRAFHHVTIGESSEYVPLNQAKNAPELWQQVIDKALEEVRSWSIRYKAYQQLSPIHKVVSKTYAKLKRGTYGKNKKAA